jgi:hypothetical protein
MKFMVCFSGGLSGSDVADAVSSPRAVLRVGAGECWPWEIGLLSETPRTARAGAGQKRVTPSVLQKETNDFG